MKNLKEFTDEIKNTGHGWYSLTSMEKPKKGLMVQMSEHNRWIKDDCDIDVKIREFISEFGFQLSIPDTFFSVDIFSGRFVKFRIMNYHNTIRGAVTNSMMVYGPILDLNTAKTYEPFAPSKCSTFVNYKAKEFAENLEWIIDRDRKVRTTKMVLIGAVILMVFGSLLTIK